MRMSYYYSLLFNNYVHNTQQVDILSLLNNNNHLSVISKIKYKSFSMQQTSAELKHI